MIKMDTDSVRTLSASVLRLADQLDNHFNSINASVISANWQSQAREEFVENFNIVVRAGSSSSAALRLMGTAVNRKVDQWDAIASVFNGPFYYLEGIWDNFINELNNSWNNLLGTIGNIRWPTASAITGISSAVVGGFVGLWPSWKEFKSPSWLSSTVKPNDLPPIQEIKESPLVGEPVLQNDFSRIAGEVKSGVADSTEFGYPRNGYNGVQSNCTWFTAQAVSAASDGKVKVSNWGPATNWLSSAKDYLKNNPDGFINSINTSPGAGDVMQLNIGHVAFVENVETINGKTIITWVEENAEGDCKWSGAEQIKVDNDAILRWRITREVDQISKYNPQFIHINY